MPQKITEKSQVAKAVGGPAMIRKLPKLDRLKVGLKVAEELGNNSAVKVCARKVIENALRKCDFSDAEAIAEKYGLKEEDMKKIALKVAKAVMGRGIDFLGSNYSIAAEIFLKYGFKNELRKTAVEIVIFQLYEGAFSDAEKVAERYGLGEEDMKRAALIFSTWEYGEPTRKLEIAKRCGLGEQVEKEAALEVFHSHMDEAQRDIESGRVIGVASKYADAAKVAKEHGLEEQMRDAALKSFRRYMKDKNYMMAARVAKKYGLDEQLMKNAAKKEFNKLMGMHKNPKFGQGYSNRDFRSEAIDTAQEYGLDDQLKRVMGEIVEEHIKYGRHSEAAETAKEHGLDKKMRKAALKILEKDLEKDNPSDAKKTIEKYPLPEEDVKKLVLKAIKVKIKRRITYHSLSDHKKYDLTGHSSDIRSIAEKWGVVVEVTKMITGVIKKFVDAGQVPDPFYIARGFGLGEETVRRVARKIYAEEMDSQNYFSAACKALYYELGEQAMKEPALRLFLDTLRKEKYSDAAEYIVKFKLKKDDVGPFTLEDQDVKKAALKAVGHCMKHKDFSVISRFVEVFGLKEDEVKQVALLAFEDSMNSQDYTSAIEIAKKYKLDKQLRKVACLTVEADLRKGNYCRAKETAEKFGLDEKLEVIRAIKGTLFEKQES